MVLNEDYLRIEYANRYRRDNRLGHERTRTNEHAEHLGFVGRYLNRTLRSRGHRSI